MIIDSLKNAKFYYALGERIAKGLKFLEENDLSQFENGKYEIEGDELFVSVQDYETKPLEQGKFEAHRKYLDIQFLIKGPERLGFGKTQDFQPVTDYDEQKDIVFLDGGGDFATAREGDFLIFAPSDAHMPCIAVDTPAYVKKAVVKVLL